MNKPLTIKNALELPGRLSRTGWQLPANLTGDDWLKCGKALREIDGSLQWWIGDWWRFGEERKDYGTGEECAQQVGLEIQTCKNAAWVAGRVPLSRRRDNLTFRHHAEVAPLPPTEQDKWLDRAERGDGAGNRLSASELRGRMSREKKRSSCWTRDQANRKKAAETGQCVVANMHYDKDAALIAWAEENDRFVRIDRTTEWGNPFEIPADGERAEVIGKFSKFYLPYKNGLLNAIDAGILRGKVLGCWCHPEECHGHTLAEIANRRSDKKPAEIVATEIAEVDG